MSAFPFLRKPWQHQLDIFERAKDDPEHALFADMGTGKTFLTINLLRFKYLKHGRILRTLILAPPVVRVTWAREFESSSKLRRGAHIQVLEGSGKQRLKAFEATRGAASVFISNYEALLNKDLFKALKEWKPEVLVCDEAHYLKSGQAKRTKLVIQLADQTAYRYILTGTPILKDAMDIWALYRILDKGQSFDKNFFAFRAHYFQDKNSGMPKQAYFPAWCPKPGLEDAFNKIIYRKASRVMKKDCMTLPPFIRKELHVELGAEQKRAYMEMYRDLVAYLEGKAATASIALTKALRLQQIVSGHLVAEDGSVLAFKENPRLEALKEAITQLMGEHKIIIWASFRHDIESIRKLFGDPLVLQGGMTDAARQEAMDLFQTSSAPGHGILLANQGAGGVGVTLTAASYAFYYSRNFNLGHDLQSEARNYRGGSEIHSSVTRVDLLTPGTIDEKVFKRLESKLAVAESILGVKDLL